MKEADKKAPAPATPTPQKKTVAAVAVMEVDNSAELAKEAAMLFLAGMRGTRGGRYALCE